MMTVYKKALREYAESIKKSQHKSKISVNDIEVEVANDFYAGYQAAINSIPAVSGESTAYSALIKIASEMAMRRNMPDPERVEYSINIPKKSWRSINRMCDIASQQCADWSYELRKIADEAIDKASPPNQSARIAELEAKVNQYLKQRDDLGSHTVEVYKAIDALLESSEECNFDDVTQKVAPIELWDDLEEALTKNEDKG